MEHLTGSEPGSTGYKSVVFPVKLQVLTDTHCYTDINVPVCTILKRVYDYLLVESTGIEPETFAVQMRRSPKLSYDPLWYILVDLNH